MIIHGPNMPLLGKVSTASGTRLTLDKINTALRRRANELEIELKIYQFYDQSRIVKVISRARNKISGLLICPGALAPVCYSIKELLSIIKIPAVEIFPLEFPYTEDFCAKSILKDVVIKQVKAISREAYLQALELLYNHLKK